MRNVFCYLALSCNYVCSYAMQSKNYIIVYQFAEELIIVLLHSEHEAPQRSSRTGNGTRESVSGNTYM